jgi:type 1 fimbriae regulatory protein FimB/type 1 fimbriae regulatory protein FimE
LNSGPRKQGNCDGKSRRRIRRSNIAAARDNRHGHRDATAILAAYRHALRSSELVTLHWDDVDFTTGRLHLRRAKGGETAVHPISGKEMRALRRLQRESERGN